MPATIGQPVGDGIGRIPGFVNAYVLVDPSGTYLIDTTMNGHARPVQKAFERAQTPLASIGTILLTHSHPDHVGGAAALSATGRPLVVAHAADIPRIDGREPTPIPWFLRLFLHARPVAVGRALADGDSIGPLRVVHAPGHTAGEVALYEPGRRILFSGDSVVERRGRLTLPAPRAAADLRQAVDSLRLLRALEIETLLPGHGVPVTRNVAGLLDDLIARAPAEFLRGRAAAGA